MRPLLFANWRAINQAFCALMWLIALILLLLIAAHLLPSDPTVHGHAWIRAVH